ncbi:uncharacterized protein [Leptinotarsa decemlineata]|uniref:uncharacterized protein n=1 Tax=Leptinotarsa decemlineata TaxID=7539 RepID=UPI003D3075A7
MNKNDESEPENCNELQKKIDEAIKVLFDNRGDQKDELLNDEIFLIGDQVNGTTLTELSNTKQEIAKRNNVQGEPERHDIDIAEAGPSGTFMDNKKRCENDQNYVPDKSGSESEYEESEDEYLNMSEQLRKEMGAGEQENNEMLVENIEENMQPKRKRKQKADTRCRKRQECKTKRQKGEKYDGFRKNPEGKWTIDVAKPPREFKPFCNCKISVISKKIQSRVFTDEDRQHIFKNFRHDMTWPEKKIYVSSLVDIVSPKDMKNRINETSRRSKTFVCHLKKNGIRVRVCQVMFINTLNLGT